MPSAGYHSLLITSQVDGAALGNTVTATSLLPGASKFTLPANFLAVLGQKLRIRVGGRISNIVTTPGTFTPDVRFGSIVVFTGGAIPLNVVAKTNVTFEMIIDLVVRSIGSVTAATLLGTGRFISESVSGAAAGTAGVCMVPATAPAAGTGFDSTVASVIDVFGTWSIANAGNTVTVHDFEISSLN